MGKKDWILMFACFVLAVAIVAMVVYIEKDVEMRRESGDIPDIQENIEDTEDEDADESIEDGESTNEIEELDGGGVTDDVDEDEIEEIEEAVEEEEKGEESILEQLNITIKNKDGNNKDIEVISRGTREGECRFREADDCKVKIEAIGDKDKVYEVTNKTSDATPILLSGINLEPGDSCYITVYIKNKQRNGDRTTTSIALVSDKGLPLKEVKSGRAEDWTELDLRYANSSGRTLRNVGIYLYPLEGEGSVTEVRF